MSKDQVRIVLGAPLITDSFHADRCDYVFRRQSVNSRELEQRKIAVFFEDGKLKRIDGDVMPASKADAAGVKAPAAPPAPGPTAAEPKAAGQTASETSAPTAAANPPAPDKPQEKSWWQKLKEKF